MVGSLLLSCPAHGDYPHPELLIFEDELKALKIFPYWEDFQAQVRENPDAFDFETKERLDALRSKMRKMAHERRLADRKPEMEKRPAPSRPQRAPMGVRHRRWQWSK